MKEADFSSSRLPVRPLSPALSSRARGADNSRAASGSLLAAMDDATLLALIGQGDENAMGVVFDRYARPVYSVALRVLRDPAAAEDVLQEVFLQVWRKPDAMAVNRTSMGAWMTIFARRCAVNVLQRHKLADAVERVSLPNGADVSQESARHAVAEQTRLLVKQLPADQRKALELTFYDALTPAEIADTTGEGVGTVRSRVRSALLELRKGWAA